MTSQELKDWREKHGYSQQALADTLGVTGQAVRNWEHGRRPLPGWMALALAGIVATK